MPSEDAIPLEIGRWIDKAGADLERRLERQATAIILHAIYRSKKLGGRLALKGGVLTSLRYASPRQTADIDFTAMDLEPSSATESAVRTEIERSLMASAIALGYVDVVVKITSSKFKPKLRRRTPTSFPTLTMKAGFAKRGTARARALEQGTTASVIPIDISFNEPMHETDLCSSDMDDVEILAYRITELVAEKYRALLQQVGRRRFRHQDVFDIAYLIENRQLLPAHSSRVYSLLISKCKARGIQPTLDSLRQDEVRDRARHEWKSMDLELRKVPEFDDCYARILEYYEKLPWPENPKKLALG
jgi:predicted nucleotidyltransferase component of viral defense system